MLFTEDQKPLTQNDYSYFWVLAQMTEKFRVDLFFNTKMIGFPCSLSALFPQHCTWYGASMKNDILLFSFYEQNFQHYDWRISLH